MTAKSVKLFMLPNSSKKQRDNPRRWIYGLCIFGIVVVAAFLRIWYLDRIPTGVVSDETDYILNAKATYETGGSILSPRWSPLSLTTVPGEIPKAELPYILSIPFVGPFGLSLFTSRIAYALVSVGYVLIVLGIAHILLGPEVGLVAGLVAAINPWSVYYGRTAYDVPIAITGYLLAFYLLLRLKGSNLLWSIIPFLIGFYSYIGTKVLFIPYAFVTLWTAWSIHHKKKQATWFVVIGVILTLVFINYVLHLKSLDANARVSQLFTPFDATVAQNVDLERRLTLASPLTSLFTNKLVIYTKQVIIKFFGAFSPSLLFTNGEGIATFSLWEHGLFYPIDALFLIIGICVLFMTQPILLSALGGIIATSALPSVLSTAGTTYVHRSSLMYPFFTIIIAYGLVHTIRWAKIKQIKSPVLVAISLIYMLFTVNFVHLYFFRFPYYNSESFGLSQRIFTRYTTLAALHHIPVTHITGSIVGYFRSYIFYANVPTKQTIPKIRDAFATNIFHWDNATFTTTCPTQSEIAAANSTYILSDTSPCKPLFSQKSMVVIPNLSDGGTHYMIFNDRMCNAYTLSPYPTGFTIDDFLVENLSEKQFCQRFVIRYKQPLYMPEEKNPVN